MGCRSRQPSRFSGCASLNTGPAPPSPTDAGESGWANPGCAARPLAHSGHLRGLDRVGHPGVETRGKSGSAQRSPRVQPSSGDADPASGPPRPAGGVSVCPAGRGGNHPLASGTLHSSLGPGGTGRSRPRARLEQEDTRWAAIVLRSAPTWPERSSPEPLMPLIPGLGALAPVS